MSRRLPDGIFSVCSLDGAPVSAAEASLLSDADGVVEQHGQAGERLMLMVVDHAPDRGDTGCCSDRGQTLALLGDLDDAPALAAQLDLPPQSPACLLALYAFRRWGDEAPRHLPGLWTLLLWEGTTRTLTLACSAQLRDPVYVARVGDRIAVSSSLLHLSRMPWLEKKYDYQGMLLSLGRAPLRAQLGDGSLLKNARRLLPGNLYRHWKGGQSSRTWASPLTFEPWTGGLEDAVQTLETLARRSVRRSVRRHRTIAITLSGGLDSSCLAWLTASEKRADQKVVVIASAARPQSGVPDERKWIDLVAKRLGLDVHYAVPDDSTDVYVPSDEWFLGLEAPVPSHGHYVYQNIFSIARTAGADVVLGGGYGEYSLTRTGAVSSREISLGLRLRWLLGQLRQNMAQMGEDDIGKLFHVMLNRQARDRLPPSLARFTVRDGPIRAGKPEDPIGLMPGYEKCLAKSESSPLIGIRDIAPFRDLSLLTFAAGLPSGFTRDGPYSRALVRRMMESHLPREITWRTCKLPFSPEHEHLMRQQAERRRQSIKAMKDSDDWIDRPWLDQALAQISQGKHNFKVGRMCQLTSCTLAFLAWWERA